MPHTPTRNYTPTTTREAMARMAEAMTSFDELAVSSPRIQFDLKSNYPLSVIRDRVVTEGGGTVSQSGGHFLLTTDSAAGSSAMLQSVERGRYVAGIDAMGGVAVSALAQPTGDQSIEWGYIDFINGFAVGLDTDGLYLVTYKGGERIKVTRRPDWDRPLQGPPENANLDPESMTVYRIHFRWYGAGPWWLGVSADLDGIRGGQEITAHVERNPEPSDTMTNDPNQPLTVKIDNGTTSGNPLSVRVGGRHFYVMGDYDPNRRVVAEYRLEQTVGSTWVPLVAARQRNDANYPSVSVKAQGASVLSTEPLLWQIRVVPEIDSSNFLPPSFSDDGAESALEFCVDATTITNGVAIYSDLAPGGRANTSAVNQAQLPDFDLPLSQGATALCARTVNGQDSTVTSVARFREEW